MTDLTAPLGASIRIFLADGAADGVWVVEKSPVLAWHSRGQRSSLQLRPSGSHGQGPKAQGTETSEGFVVYAGSLGRAQAVPSIHAYGTQIREALIEKGVFVLDGPNLRLTEDYVFPSPSTAAMVLLGRTSNGRVEWKASDGRTLKDLQTADVPSVRDE